MRSFIFALAFAFIIAGRTASSQVSFGPAIGVQYSTSIGGYSYYHYEWEYGYKAGVFAQVPFKKNQWLRSELIFNLAGYKYQYTDVYPEGSEAISGFFHAGYLQLPVLFQRSFQSGFHFDGGAFSEYQLTQHQKEFTYTRTSLDSFTIGTSELADSHNVTANRFQAGVTASIGFMKSGFDLSISSQYYLTSLFALKEESYRNQHLFALSLGLAYHVK